MKTLLALPKFRKKNMQPVRHLNGVSKDFPGSDELLTTINSNIQKATLHDFRSPGASATRSGMSKFVALDFETGDNGADSACSIGLVRVEFGVITREEMRLIRPPRERILYTHIHGLSWDDVKDAPHFGRVWPELLPIFEGVDFIVAHNSSFDKRVLHACCQSFGIVPPTLPFNCTVQVARKTLGIYPAKLSNVCRVLGIDLNHHEALSDARACAKIMIESLARTSAAESSSVNISL